MSTNDALAPVITRYVHAVRSAGDGQWRGRSATFWLSLGLDRGTDEHVALVRDAFRTHGIVVSTSGGELGHEPPDAWIELTTAPSMSDRGSTITDLPDALFGDAPVPVDPQPDSTVPDNDLSEPQSAAISSTGAHSPTAGLSQPSTTTSGTVAPPLLGTWGDASSDTSALIICPSCGATVPLSASFCPVCDLPRSHVREQLQQRASRTGESYASLLERVRIEGWPLPEADREHQRVPVGAMIIGGIVVLSIGARLGDLVMPLLVVGAIVVLVVTWSMPTSVTALMESVLAGRSASEKTPVPTWLAVAVVVVVGALMLLS